VKIKGIIIQARKDFVDDNFGADAWERVLAALRPEDQDQLRELVLTAKWYPFELGERLRWQRCGKRGGKAR
jgi:hypothetical protein